MLFSKTDIARSVRLALVAALLVRVAGAQHASAQALSGEGSTVQRTGDAVASEPDALPEIVITGTRTPHVIDDAPVPTQVITADEIDEAATSNVEAVLSRVPDVYVRRNDDFTLGASTVRMQGLDPNKVAIVVDGRRTRGGINGVVDLRDLPAIGIDQIEILRGPASSLYGSDAMAGVINIRTRRDSTPRFDATFGAGNAGKRLVNFGLGRRVGDTRVTGTFQHDEVSIAELYGNVSDQFAGADDTQARDTARIAAEYVGEHHDIDAILDFLGESNPLSDNDNLTGTLAWRFRPTGNWLTEASISYYDFQRTNELAGFAEDIEYDDLNAQLRFIRSIDTKGFGGHLLTIGGRYRRETVFSPEQTLSNGSGNTFVAPEIDEEVYHLAGYFQLESELGDDWRLVLGASVDDHELHQTTYNPRGTLTWFPVDDARLSLTVGRGFRAPDLLQLFDVDVNNVAVLNDRVTGYAIVGNPDLEPERDLGFSLNGTYDPVPGLRVTAEIFRHELEDLIGNQLLCTGPTTCLDGGASPLPDLDGQIFSFENVSEARTEGVNLSFSARVVDLLGITTDTNRLEIRVGYSRLWTENRGVIASERGKELPFRPSARILPAFTWERPVEGLTLNVEAEYNDRQFSDFANSRAGRVEPYWQLGFKLTQSLGGLFEALGVSAGPLLHGIRFYVEGDNVTDEEVDFNGPTGAIVRKRNFVGGLQFSFEG